MTAPLFDPLSSQDAGYLRRETPTHPMHFTIAFDVEPSAGAELNLAELRRHLVPRVAAAPWLRRKVKRAAGGFGPMLWVDDPRFSIERHVLPSPPEVAHLTVDEALTAFTTAQLPRDRPLWQLFLHPAKDGEATTLFLSVHHALSDGGLMQSTMNVLFGVDAPAAAPTRRSVLRKVANSTAAVTAYAVAARVSERLHAGHAPGPGAEVNAAARAGIYGPVGPHRAIAGGSIALDELRALRRATGATINDLFVAASAAALRDAIIERDLGLPEVVALVPRNVRSTDEAAAAGNRTVSMLVPLPLEVADTQERLERVQEASAQAKAVETSAGNAGFRFDIALSNVAYGVGHRVGDHPIQMKRAGVPLQGENRLVAAAASHNGEFIIWYTADADHFPDVAKIANRTFEEFRRIAREVTRSAPVT